MSKAGTFIWTLSLRRRLLTISRSHSRWQCDYQIIYGQSIWHGFLVIYLSCSTEYDFWSDYYWYDMSKLLYNLNDHYFYQGSYMEKNELQVNYLSFAYDVIIFTSITKHSFQLITSWLIKTKVISWCISKLRLMMLTRWRGLHILVTKIVSLLNWDVLYTSGVK